MKALDDLLVVDFSRVLAGPFCTMHLADMGAEVLKIERPGGGDDTRRFGPPFVNGVSTYFLAVNRGKKSITLDLKNPEDVAKAKKLCAQADVVVENFRPGTMEKLGLDYDTLRADNPRLVYASIAGYGAVFGLDEYTKKPGYDLVAQGVGGVQYITGAAGGPPTKTGISIADLTAGLYCFQGILVALLARHRTGRGQRVDISMQDGQAALLTYHATAQLIGNKTPVRLGNAHPSIAPYETFKSADGFVNIAAANDPMFKRCCDALGLIELTEDPRFLTNALRVENRPALKSIMEETTVGQSTDALVTLLAAHGVVAGPILDIEGVMNHPQLRARDMIVTQEQPSAGTIQTVGSPLQMTETPPAYELPPPDLGQHNDEVFAKYL